jgi:hypothetical protein
MPIHDWSRVDAGLFHHFHQAWTIALSDALNGGVLPDEYFALADHSVGGAIPDVITLQRKPADESQHGGIAIAESPPQARFTCTVVPDTYVARANRINIQHRLGDIVAVIEIVSPGNKASQIAFQTFTDKTRDLLSAGINLLVVDLFPPTRRDPQGIHPVIWYPYSYNDDSFELPADKRLTVAAYNSGYEKQAYVEPVAVGDVLPSLPIFLDHKTYVPAPLEVTYEQTWKKCPAPVRQHVEEMAARS